MGSVDKCSVVRFLLGPRVKLEVCAQLFLRFLMRKAENGSGKLSFAVLFVVILMVLERCSFRNISYVYS